MNHPRTSPSKRGYNRNWQKARKIYLEQNPLCKLCNDLGRVKAATVVDHIEPHRGNDRLFWDRDNWQPLCKTCHDSVKQTQEKSGYLRGADKDGNPLDNKHHWKKDNG